MGDALGRYLLTLFSVFFLSSQVWAAPQYVPGEVIIKLRSSEGKGSQSKIDKFTAAGKMQLRNSFARMNLYHLSLKPGKSVERSLAELRADPDVLYAEPNYYLYKNSTGVIEPYSLSDIEALASGGEYLATGAPIHAQETWQSVTTLSASKPIVAIIDTGVDLTHPAFVDSGAIWTNSGEIPGNGVDDDGNGYVDDVNGWNYVSNSGTLFDDDGHGTHVSGIVLGVGQDVFNAPFTAAKIQLMPLKFLDSSGIGKTSDAIKAVYYAVDNGAHVLNNSWGGPTYSAALHEAVTYSYENGVAFVAAAGNTGANNDISPMYPASYDVPHVISVAATTDLDELASFSNFGINSVDLGSPGVFILSTIPGGYGTSSGTSMSTPFVSGVAALMLVEAPQMLGFQVKSIIFQEADYINSLTSRVSTEARVNVNASVLFAKTASVDTSQPVYTFSNQDRALASTLASGGCGTVKTLYDKFGQRGGPGGSPGPTTWYVLIVIAMLLAPILIASYVREKMPENRRRYQRFKIDTGVIVEIDGRELEGRISSISQGGVKLDTGEQLENGRLVRLKISSPDRLDEVTVRGRIVWSVNQCSYGIQFSGTKQSVIEAIGAWTKSLQPN